MPLVNGVLAHAVIYSMKFQAISTVE